MSKSFKPKANENLDIKPRTWKYYISVMQSRLKLMTDLPPHHTLKSKTQLVANIDCECIKSGRFQTLFENIFPYKSIIIDHLCHQPFRWQFTSNSALSRWAQFSALSPLPCACSKNSCWHLPRKIFPLSLPSWNAFKCLIFLLPSHYRAHAKVRNRDISHLALQGFFIYV